ncbi:unnamed protein product [Schistocephalus solidus]|uniref:DUF5753 domain-containing protein n=1 Tax=Schistocephalus solidus TaxID=70667 RepID=A0A183SB10_SCHSO|nr:unnamed protein product [Schistocephalus solidus]
MGRVPGSIKELESAIQQQSSSPAALTTALPANLVAVVWLFEGLKNESQGTTGRVSPVPDR